MNLSWTLSRYLARRFAVAIALTILVFYGLIYVLDLVELLRRGASKEEMSFGRAVFMTFLKLPMLGAETLPFAVMFGSMIAFNRLTRHQELVVTRAAGVSVWQFLLPPLAVAMMLGVFIVTVYNPVAAALGGRYEQLEAQYLRGKTSLLAMSANGFWIRQADGNVRSVVHALRVSDRGMRLADVTVFQFADDDSFLARLDARHAQLQDGHWALSQVWKTGGDQEPRFHDNMTVETSLTPTQVQESFAKPQTISFWDLPRFIEIAEKAGFSARRYRMHWYALTAMPIFLCTMVLVAASVSTRLTRLGGVTELLVLGVICGFLLYFVSDLSIALGTSGLLPPLLAAWAPAGIASLLGIATLLYLEDG